jgi:hypothetical protein
LAQSVSIEATSIAAASLSSIPIAMNVFTRIGSSPLISATVSHKLSKSRAHRLTDLHVAARREPLHLEQKPRTIGQEPPVLLAHDDDSRDAPQIPGGGDHSAPHALERFSDDHEEKFLFGAEQPVNIGLADIRAAGDRLGRCPMQPRPGELVRGDVENLGLSFNSGHPLHSCSSLWTYSLVHGNITIIVIG